MEELIITPSSSPSSSSELLINAVGEGPVVRVSLFLFFLEDLVISLSILKTNRDFGVREIGCAIAGE
jgi:hypothetical protein